MILEDEMGKKLTLAIFVSLLLVLTSTSFAFAAGQIDTDNECVLSLSYIDEGSPIEGTVFNVYKVADVDAYGRLTVTDSFKTYPVEVKDNSQDDWRVLASTLKGYVLRDGLDSTASGKTNALGDVSYSLPTGLYLVLGEKSEKEGYVYDAVPFLVLLPGLDEIKNDWDYEISSIVKYSKEVITEEKVECKVIKVWNDEGYEAYRPKEITVDLLKEGKVYDTKILNEANGWTYTWDNLDASGEYYVAEKEIDNYSIAVEKVGNIFTITNTTQKPINATDPPVSKKIVGGTPSTDSEFVFVLVSEDSDSPMPSGSDGTSKEITITGEGESEFGEIEFIYPGEYKYSVYEKDTGEKGYLYDDTIYTISYNVYEEDNELIIESTIYDSDGVIKDDGILEFENEYYYKRTKLPQTGQLWWPIPILLCLALVSFVIGYIIKKNEKNNN